MLSLVVSALIRFCSGRVASRLFFLAPAACVVLAGCGGATAATYTTEVAILPGEDLVDPCAYDMLIQEPDKKQNGVLVIYERADSGDVYNDPRIKRMARSLGFAMIFARQCDARSFDDLQPDASKGPGRALFAALSQFATLSGHPEFDKSRVALFGFSAAGVLTLTMANYAPDRVMTGIAYAPGSPYLDILNLSATPDALRVPILILANSQDPVAGTTRGLSYFKRAYAAGAKWGFGVQGIQMHCCTLTTRPMLLSWIPAVFQGDPDAAQTTQFVCTPDGVLDRYSEPDCQFTYAAIGDQPFPGVQNGWLPDINSAETWLSWVTNTDPND